MSSKHSQVTALPPCPQSGHSGEFGAYGRFDTSGWFQDRVMNDGTKFRIWGRGNSPTKEQIRLWEQLDNDFDFILGAAKESLTPPKLEHGFTDGGDFDAESFKIDQIELLEIDRFKFIMRSPFCDVVVLWPHVVLDLGGVVHETEWVP